MKIYKTQRAVEKDIKNGVLAIKGDVKFECSISIDASIIVIAGDINARDITAGNITARNITAGDVNAWDITAWDINVRDINVRDITACNVTAGNINARDINVRDITARNILYYAVCFAYNNIKCLSIKARRPVSKHFCLDGKITIKKEEPKETIKIGDNVYDKQEVEKALENVKSLKGGSDEDR